MGAFVVLLFFRKCNPLKQLLSLNIEKRSVDKFERIRDPCPGRADGGYNTVYNPRGGRARGVGGGSINQFNRGEIFAEKRSI